MPIYESMTQLVGNTPLLRLNRYCAAHRLEGSVLAKLECFNPLSSVKDRAALAMIDQAERDGRLREGGVVVEPTSGNTGIGLAGVAACRGYRLILTMPESMSVERRKLLAQLGAEVVLTPAALGMRGAVEKARELAETLPGAFVPSQFENPANPDAHYRTTARELVSATAGKIDAFVSGVGTGGTLTGCARYFREAGLSPHVVAVEPQGSQVLAGKPASGHKIQGIGANFVPKNLDRGLVDEILPVRDEDAMAAAREAAKLEGILVGISSGAALYAAAQVAGRKEFAGKNVVAVFPDTGERYLSTELFD